MAGRKENKAFRFRLYPNKEQRILLARTFGCCRFLYNKMLADKIEEYKKSKTMLKNTPAGYKTDYPWLKEVDSLALANAQLHLERAYKNFFRDPKIGFPKFKAKHIHKDSYTTNLVNGNIVLTEKKLKLPKLGMIRIKVHREVPEEYRLKSVTVSREPSGKYYASILYEYDAVESQAAPKEVLAGKVLGMDYAMRGLAVLSDGRCCDYPGYYRCAQERLKREQRRLSHCRRGSRNYEKQRRRVAVCHEKVRHQRKDYHHKISRELSETYSSIAVEDIDMKNMSRCLHLGKGVMDNGYGMFRDMLEQKLSRKGKKLIRINRFYPSSKRCSRCGQIKNELTLNDRVYRCSCGNCIDRDLNAAINIREEGIRMLTA